jgi:hypothetical protein
MKILLFALTCSVGISTRTTTKDPLEFDFDDLFDFDYCNTGEEEDGDCHSVSTTTRNPFLRTRALALARFTVTAFRGPAAKYSYDVVDRALMCPWMTHKADSRLLYDIANGHRFAPILTTGYDDIPQPVSGTKRIVIGELLEKTRTSVAFSVQDEPTLVIKYMHDCFARNPVHPALREQFMLEKSRAGYAVFVSPPTVFPETQTAKTDFDLSIDEVQRCKEKRGTIRFAVLERAESKPLIGPKSDTGNFLKGMIVMRDLVLKVHRMHQRNRVIHGNIGPHNVIESAGKEFGLIGFDRAVTIEESLLGGEKPEHLSYQRSDDLWIQSHWEMKGFASACRDDLFRILLVSGVVMHGKAYMQHLQWLDREELLRFKESSPSLFTIGGKFPSLGIALRRIMGIEDRLNAIVDHVRSLEFLQDGATIRYDWIIDQIDDILAHLS